MYYTFLRNRFKRIKTYIVFSFSVVSLLIISTSDSVISNRYNIIDLQKNNLACSKLMNINQINWSEKAKIVASDGFTNDLFGISIDIDGNYCVVGARDDDGERGSAYVFKRNGDLWIQYQKLIASDGNYVDWFGISVSIKGNFIFVGADADDNENGINAGSVYVFRLIESSWVEQNKLLASDGTKNDYFGRYVDLEDDYAIIGTYYDNNITGSAYIFKLDGTNWIEDDKLVASDGLPNDYFGISTSINGEYAIVGAYRDDNINGIDAGSVYVFKRTDNGWIEEDKLIASDGTSQDRFGISISLCDQYMIIGSYYDDGYTGSAYIFKNNGDGWLEEDKLIASDKSVGDFFGRSVSIDGKYIVVGAWGDSDSSGSVYIFKNTNNIWIEENKLTTSDNASEDRFGYQVSLDGRYAVIGAYLDDNINGVDAGAAYIFERHNEPVLKVDGVLNWINVSINQIITSNLTVENIGEFNSELDWNIIDWPTWGTWAFTPMVGYDLKPEDGLFSVQVSVKTPFKKNKAFTGKVKIVNMDDPDNFCEIDAFLKTPRVKNIHGLFIIQLSEKYQRLFIILKNIFMI